MTVTIYEYSFLDAATGQIARGKRPGTTRAIIREKGRIDFNSEREVDDRALDADGFLRAVRR